MLKTDTNLSNTIKNIIIKHKKPKFDYTFENTEDEIFQSILILTESLYEGESVKVNKEDLEASVDFLLDKIDYLTNLKDTFGTTYRTDRFKDITKYLDSLLIEEPLHNTLDDFEFKISVTLDLLYTVLSKITFYQKNYLN